MGLLTLMGVGNPPAGIATNRLLEENGDGLLFEDSSGDLALE